MLYLFIGGRGGGKEGGREGATYMSRVILHRRKNNAVGVALGHGTTTTAACRGGRGSSPGPPPLSLSQGARVSAGGESIKTSSHSLVKVEIDQSDCSRHPGATSMGHRRSTPTNHTSANINHHHTPLSPISSSCPLSSSLRMSKASGIKHKSSTIPNSKQHLNNSSIRVQFRGSPSSPSLTSVTNRHRSRGFAPLYS